MTETAQMRETLRQMIAVLQAERQALAGLDLDAIMGCATDKVALCGTLDLGGALGPGLPISEECRGLLDAARRLNEVNRQVRNLIAANVAARLDALTGSPALYRAAQNASPPMLTPPRAADLARPLLKPLQRPPVAGVSLERGQINRRCGAPVQPPGRGRDPARRAGDGNRLCLFAGGSAARIEP